MVVTMNLIQFAKQRPHLLCC
uniref:Uncharacterized protein MANES_18G005400 n=1 Tax=Rhizophora mucronata TaxID=61149 RepID=A0A2P2KQC9_RHIMU